MMVSFGRWSPGLADTTQGRSDVIDSVVPLADGNYGPMPQLVTASGAAALSGGPRGHISFPKADGVYERYVASASNWYELTAGGALNSVASGHSVPSGDDESFERFGNKLLGSNTTDGLRAYDFETDTDDGTISAAPAARFIFEVGNVVMALDCDGDNRLIQNSAINDHTNWTDGGADYQPLENGGALIAGVAVSQGAAIIFQREAIRFIQFGGSGGGPLYSQHLMTDRAGAVGAASVVPAMGGAFFMDTDGPKFIAPGMARAEAIGAKDGIDRWVTDNVSAGDLAKIEGAYDRFRRMVFWRVPVSGDSDTVFSKMIGYHVDYDKWTSLTVTTSALFTTALPGFVWNDLTDTWDSYTEYPWADRYWQGGEPLFAGFDGDFKFATFSGTPMAYTLETADFQLPQSRILGDLTFIGDDTSAQVRLGQADRIGDSLTWKDAVSLSASGVARTRARGKRLRGRVTGAAGNSWTNASGFDHFNAGGR